MRKNVPWFLWECNDECLFIFAGLRWVWLAFSCGYKWFDVCNYCWQQGWRFEIGIFRWRHWIYRRFGKERYAEITYPKLEMS